MTTFPAGCNPQVPVSDRRYYPVYQACIDLDLPIVVNAGIAGPRVPSACQDVMHFDQVCYDFPELRIVMRHGAEPWEELAVKLMLKWPGLHYMTSAFAPKYYPKAIIDYANTRGADKIMYAGYFPMALTLERIFTELADVPSARPRVAEVPARQRHAGVQARQLIPCSSCASICARRRRARPHADLYAAALDMAQWAEGRGCMSVVVSEHHMSDDGYLPSPTVLAGAMAARTSTVAITVAALVLPLYEPVRLAEEMVVLDIVSGGRMLFVAALGYRPAEYEMHGVDFARRARVADEKLGVVLRAKTGEAFTLEGRRVQVTPAPITEGGPAVMWGGGSVAAARRAGRHGIGFFAQASDPALRVAYEHAARQGGHEPGLCVLPPPDAPMTVFVADDPDRAWHELGPDLLHDARSYAEWNRGDTGTASLSFAPTVEVLRAERASHQILSVDEAVAHVRAHGFLPLHPLIGGLPPQIAWPYLQTVADRVVPALAETS